MSRIAKSPVNIPCEVELEISSQKLAFKSSKGNLVLDVHTLVNIKRVENELQFSPKNNGKQSKSLAGTMRSLAHNIVLGLTRGFEKKLQLVGVGYRVQLVKDKTLNLSLGYSKPVLHQLPEGIVVEVPNLTEIVIKGIDKQLVGQVAAEIRDYRRPEPYKGKGIRYVDEYVRRKEAKKK